MFQDRIRPRNIVCYLCVLFLKHHAMNKVCEANDFNCNVPLSDSYRILWPMFFKKQEVPAITLKCSSGLFLERINRNK